MKSKLCRLGVFVLISVTLLSLLPVINAGCQPKFQPGTFTDDLGREVRIEEVPQRIISLAPSNTEILFALGLGNKVVGVSKYCDYPEEAKEKEKLGGFFGWDTDRIVELETDLVLATGGLEKSIIGTLEDRGITVIAFRPESLEGILENITLVGRITANEEKASNLVDELKAKIKAVTEKTESLPPERRPRVFSCGWHEPFWTCGSGTFIHDLIQKGGGENITQDLSGWSTIELKTVLARNPEVIEVAVEHDQSKDLTFQWIRNQPALRVTDAVKNNRVYWIDPNLLARPGPRIVIGLEQFARLIHPELFP